MTHPDEATPIHGDPLDAVIAEYLQQVEAGNVPGPGSLARPPSRPGRTLPGLLRRL